MKILCKNCGKELDKKTKQEIITENSKKASLVSHSKYSVEQFTEWGKRGGRPVKKLS